MSVSSFVPNVWSARLQENLHKSLVFANLCNHAWEGEISQYGDTLHINTLADVTVKPYRPGDDIDDPEELNGTDTTLTIDHGAYCNFYLNDVDAAQAWPDVLDAAMRNAAIRLAEDTESYVLGVIRGGAGTTETRTVPDGGMWELIVGIRTAMDKLNVPRTGRKLVMPSDVEAELLLDDRFVTGSGAFAQTALAEGAVARTAGFDIYISNDLSKEVIAMTEDGVTFAQQIAKMEAYRREKGFDDGVKALSLCGAKVVQPACVYRCVISE